MKRTLLLILFSFFLLKGFAQQGIWISQSSGFLSQSSGVRYISVVDTNIAWAVSYDGSGTGLPRQDYTRTTNGGNSWVRDSVPVSGIYDWSMLFALDDSNAWALFFNDVFKHAGRLYKTTDAGATWTQKGNNIYTSTTESFPNDIYFWNKAEGVVMGDPITTSGSKYFDVYTTSDSGNTWTRSDTANLKAVVTDEANQITHFQVIGDTVWFDSNEGRVFRSVDRGHTWTVSNTNLLSFQGIIDVCFFNHLNGIARYYNDTTTSNDFVETNDGGTTWSTIFNPIGDCFGGDIKAVPGEDSMLVTTGISTSSNYWGTSYSLDRGRNWTTIETANQRGVLGIADSLHMWCGGFTTSPQSDGIFKWEGISLIGCNDPNVNSGTTTATRDTVCFGDTSVIHTSGIFAPVNGDYFGFSYAISAQPISGSLDPNNEPSIVGSYRIRMPAVATDSFNLINDTSFFGNPQGPPFGTYYLTPVAFGNATAATSPPIRFLGDVVLDPNCTYTGTSVRVTIVPPGVAPCPPVGVNEIYSRMLTVTSTMKDKTTLDIGIGSAKSGRALIQVLDLTGRVLRTLEFNVNEGMNHELVNVESLASGTYLIKAEMNGAKSTGKVFKY